MPTYEYKCDNCEHHFEKFQSITASVLKKCPRCGKNTLQRLIGTGAGIIFKGSGFYQTDYRSETYAQASKKESEAAKPKEKTETKSETAKTEVKSESQKTSEPKPEKKEKKK